MVLNFLKIGAPPSITRSENMYFRNQQGGISGIRHFTKKLSYILLATRFPRICTGLTRLYAPYCVRLELDDFSLRTSLPNIRNSIIKIVIQPLNTYPTYCIRSHI